MAACDLDAETHRAAAADGATDPRVLARRERERLEARRQRGSAHLDAAEMFARVGDAENARVHLAALTEFPEWAARSREIGARLK